jgi:hypothetical protein
MIMKAIMRAIFIFGILILLSCPLWAGNTDNHDLTVTISAINEIDVSGNLSITIDTATAGQQPNSETDSTSTLSYTTNSATDKKITAQYSVVGGDTGITIEATADSASGTSQGQQTVISAGAVDLIRDLTQCADAAQQLEYEVTATVDATVGNHVFTITYTLTDE